MILWAYLDKLKIMTHDLKLLKVTSEDKKVNNLSAHLGNFVLWVVYELLKM